MTTHDPSLLGRPLDNNDLSDLAQIFSDIMEYHCTHRSPMKENYLRALKTIVGLGFTAALVDSDLLSIYQPRLNQFIEYGDFERHPGYREMVATIQAELINEGAYMFRVIGYPNYYRDFIEAIEKVLGKVSITLSEKEASYILEKIRKMRREDQIF